MMRATTSTGLAILLALSVGMTGLTATTERASAGILGGALGGALIGGIVGRGPGAVAGAVIGGITSADGLGSASAPTSPVIVADTGKVVCGRNLRHCSEALPR
jgi:hypothetical protein